MLFHSHSGPCFSDFLPWWCLNSASDSAFLQHSNMAWSILFPGSLEISPSSSPSTSALGLGGGHLSDWRFLKYDPMIPLTTHLRRKSLKIPSYLVTLNYTEEGSASFLCKDKVGNILGFVEHTVSVITTQLCMKAAKDTTNGWTPGCACVPIKLYLQILIVSLILARGP